MIISLTWKVPIFFQYNKQANSFKRDLLKQNTLKLKSDGNAQRHLKLLKNIRKGKDFLSLIFNDFSLWYCMIALTEGYNSVSNHYYLKPYGFNERWERNCPEGVLKLSPFRLIFLL